MIYLYNQCTSGAVNSWTIVDPSLWIHGFGDAAFIQHGDGAFSETWWGQVEGVNNWWWFCRYSLLHFTSEMLSSLHWTCTSYKGDVYLPLRSHTVSGCPQDVAELMHVPLHWQPLVRTGHFVCMHMGACAYTHFCILLTVVASAWNGEQAVPNWLTFLVLISPNIRRRIFLLAILFRSPSSRLCLKRL